MKPVVLFGKGPTFNPAFDQSRVARYYKVAINQAGMEVDNVDLILTIDMPIRDLLCERGYEEKVIAAISPEWAERWGRPVAGSGDYALRFLGELGCRRIRTIGVDLYGGNGFDYVNKKRPDPRNQARIKKEMGLTAEEYGLNLVPIVPETSIF